MAANILRLEHYREGYHGQKVEEDLLYQGGKGGKGGKKRGKKRDSMVVEF